MPDIQPMDVIIIGAPRSGTNMLRDVLCRLEGFCTWPCDEINYAWRHGNARWPSDALPAELADVRVVRYLRRAFARRRQIGGCPVVVEKTCANSLRVPFVDRVLPDARYVFIHRDPLDAVVSATKRWNAPFELAYTLAKARFVPVSDLPYYGLRFLRNRLHRLLSKERTLAFWGPRLDDMDENLRRHPLLEVCALQWQECVQRSAEAFAGMPQHRVAVVRYEDFVQSPVERLSELCDQLGHPRDRGALERAVTGVSSRSVGGGRRQLSDGERRAVEAIAAPAEDSLRRLVRLRADAPRPPSPPPATPGSERSRCS